MIPLILLTTDLRIWAQFGLTLEFGAFKSNCNNKGIVSSESNVVNYVVLYVKYWLLEIKTVRQKRKY